MDEPESSITEDVNDCKHMQSEIYDLEARNIGITSDELISLQVQYDM